MVVYTHLSDFAMRQLLRRFQLGELHSVRNVAALPERTLVEIRTARGLFHVRIANQRTLVDVRYEEALLSFLLHAGVHVPKMLLTSEGSSIVSLTAKQHLTVFAPLPGRDVGVFEITVTHAFQAGAFLARLHQIGRGFNLRRRCRIDPVQVRQLLHKSRQLKFTGHVLQDLHHLTQETDRASWSRDLPRGMVHGDARIAQTRFRDGQLSGMGDFEMAANGPLVVDLATALADWGFLHDSYRIDRAVAFVQGYESQRRLRPKERMDLFTSLRFVLARLAILTLLLHERQTNIGSYPYRDYRHYLRRLESLLASSEKTRSAEMWSAIPAQSESFPHRQGASSCLPK